jgi:hypothetical protein
MAVKLKKPLPGRRVSLGKRGKEEKRKRKEGKREKK